MSYPHFMIIGAMKCGTSTLAAQLGAQPGLFITDPKEPNYFSDDAQFARGPEWYASLFDAARPNDLRGEASTHYTKRPDYPQTLERMRALPTPPRLIYMIRDPLARLVSHYIHAWSEGEINVPIEQAVKECPELVNYGRYGWQIEPFLAQYPGDCVLLTSLERLSAEPNKELSRIAAHIGCRDNVRWAPEIGEQNVSSKRVRKLPFHSLLVDSALATTLRRLLVPKAVRTRIRESRQMHTRPELSEDLRVELAERFLPDRATLAAMFPDDPSLTLAYPFAP